MKKVDSDFDKGQKRMEELSLTGRLSFILRPLFLSMVLTACGGGGDESSLPRSTKTPLGPVSITRVLDTTKSVEARVTSTGGTLTATSAEGVVYTLTFPENALISPANISLIPLQSAELPFKEGMIAGVEILPSGLTLAKEAFLQIQLPNMTSTDSLAGYGYVGSGEEFFLYPHKVVANSLLLSVNHFSGYGITLPSPEEIGVQENHVPTLLAEKLSQAMAIVLYKALLGNETLSDEDAKELIAAFNYSWFLEIRPGFIDARESKSIEKFVESTANFLAWLAELQKLEGWIPGTSELDPLVELGWDYVSQVVAVIQEEAFRLCKEEHDLTQIVEMIKLDKYIQYLPHPASVTLINLDLMVACLSFEVDYDYTLVGYFKDLWDYEVTVKETYVLDFNDTVISNEFVPDPYGTVSVTDVSVQLDDPTCSATVGELSFRGAIQYLQLDFNLQRGKTAVESRLVAKDFSFVGHPLLIHCTYGGPTESGAGNLFEFDLPKNDEGDLEYTNWSILTGDVYARWQAAGTYHGVHSITGDKGELRNLTLTIRHTPASL